MRVCRVHFSRNRPPPLQAARSKNKIHRQSSDVVPTGFAYLRTLGRLFLVVVVVGEETVAVIVFALLRGMCPR